MSTKESGFVSLSLDAPVWEKFPTVAPLVLVSTKDPDGQVDIAPKHLAMPVSWQNWFGGRRKEKSLLSREEKGLPDTAGLSRRKMGLSWISTG